MSFIFKATQIYRRDNSTPSFLLPRVGGIDYTNRPMLTSENVLSTFAPIDKYLTAANASFGSNNPITVKMNIGYN